MTHRDELNALSNAEFAKWVFTLMGGRDSKLCPVTGRFCRKRRWEEGQAYPCPDIIADWLRVEE